MYVYDEMTDSKDCVDCTHIQNCENCYKDKHRYSFHASLLALYRMLTVLLESLPGYVAKSVPYRQYPVNSTGQDGIL